MSSQTCLLTRKDFAILAAMHERCTDGRDPLASILTRKLEAARLVSCDDVPANVATLNSRISFRVDGLPSDVRIIVDDCTSLPVGMALPIATQRGLALIGLAEGHEFRLINRHGTEEAVVLEKVHYQPEAARRETAVGSDDAKKAETAFGLKLIRGEGRREPRRTITSDNPGPSAA